MRVRETRDANDPPFPNGDDSSGPDVRALRALVRVLAREAAREAFARAVAESPTVGPEVTKQ